MTYQSIPCPFAYVTLPQNFDSPFLFFGSLSWTRESSIPGGEPFPQEKFRGDGCACAYGVAAIFCAPRGHPGLQFFFANPRRTFLNADSRVRFVAVCAIL